MASHRVTVSIKKQFNQFFLEVYDFIERHNFMVYEITEPATYKFYRNYQTKQGPYKKNKTTNIA
jgi:hypothetical protein